MMLASVQDLSDRLGQALTEGTPDYTRAASNIQDASVLVSAATRVWQPGDNIPDVVKLVTLQAAERKFRNPTGSTTRTMGPFTEGVSGFAAAGLYLTDEELSLLEGYAETTGGLVSVPTRRVGEHTWRWIEFAYDQHAPTSDPIPYFAERDEGLWGPC